MTLLVLAFAALATVARAVVLARRIVSDPDNGEFLHWGRRLWGGERLYSGDMQPYRTPLGYYLLGWTPSVGVARLVSSLLALGTVAATALLARTLVVDPAFAWLAVGWLVSQGVFLGALVNHSYHSVVGAFLALGTWALVTHRPELVVLCALGIAATRLMLVPLLGLALAWACWHGAWWSLGAMLPIAAFLAHPRRRQLLAYVPGCRWATSAQIAPRFQWAADGRAHADLVNASWRHAAVLTWRQYRLVLPALAAAAWSGTLPWLPTLVLLLALACCAVAVPYAASALGYVQTFSPLLAVCCAAAPWPIALAGLVAGPWSSRPLGLPFSRADRWTQGMQSLAFAVALVVIR